MWGTRWRSWSRHCATNRKVTGSTPDGVIGMFHWHSPSGRTKALGLTQPLTGMSKRQSNPITGLDRPWGFQEVQAPRFTRNISWEVKAARADILAQKRRRNGTETWRRRSCQCEQWTSPFYYIWKHFIEWWRSAMERKCDVVCESALRLLSVRGAIERPVSCDRINLSKTERRRCI
jgi:hypothetical protein